MTFSPVLRRRLYLRVAVTAPTVAGSTSTTLPTGLWRGLASSGKSFS